MRKFRDDLTAGRARALLDYDPETGIFTWRPRSDARKEVNTRWEGKRAGNLILPRGRRTKVWRLVLDMRLYLAHRVAWLHFYGEWPAGEVDHVNTDSTDNRITNLRLATHQQNSTNQQGHSDSKTGVKGVSPHKAGGGWYAEIMAQGARRRKYFQNFDEAVAWRRKQAAEMHGEFSGDASD